MDLNAYQQQAQQTDRVPERGDTRIGIDLVVPLLGLAGETGELLSEYKKHLRDGDAHRLFKERVAEELGDLLWYVANVAAKFDLKLGEIADGNLRKTRDRWGKQDSSELVLDAACPDHERLPRQFEVELTEVVVQGKTKIRTFVNGEPMGNDLTDNAYDPDGYRFHDVFHLGYTAVLGWSPVIRKLLNRKRKSDDQTDEVEDGGRAQVIEEGVAALVFDYAKGHGWLDSISDLDYQLLRTIKGITSHLEVKARAMGEWQQAILLGYRVWREVSRNNGGRIGVDLDDRSMSYLGVARATNSVQSKI